MRSVPSARSATIPAFFNRRRCRDTAGRLIGKAAAISWTGLSPPLRSRRISRRVASPSASKRIAGRVHRCHEQPPFQLGNETATVTQALPSRERREQFPAGTVPL